MLFGLTLKKLMLSGILSTSQDFFQRVRTDSPDLTWPTPVPL